MKVRSPSPVRPPEMPRTLIRWVPVGVEEEAMRVRARLKRLDPVTWTPWGERESPWGTWSWPFIRDRTTSPWKPFWEIKVRATLPP